MVVRRLAGDTGDPSVAATEMPMRSRELGSVGVEPCRKPLVTLKLIGYVIVVLTHSKSPWCLRPLHPWWSFVVVEIGLWDSEFCLIAERVMFLTPSWQEDLSWVRIQGINLGGWNLGTRM